MNAEIDDLLTAAAAAVHAAQTALRKGASPRDLDVLRKANGLTPTRSDDAITKSATAALADLNRRLDRLEAGRDIDAQTPRKTYSVS
jgi:hypothetical protein